MSHTCPTEICKIHEVSRKQRDMLFTLTSKASQQALVNVQGFRGMRTSLQHASAALPSSLQGRVLPIHALRIGDQVHGRPPQPLSQRRVPPCSDACKA